jgi:hypothetical protein
MNATRFDLNPALLVTECDTMSENRKLAIFAPSRRCGGLPKAHLASDPVAARITAFLKGESDGGELLHALYDHVLDEPIPQSMRALLNK